jgi:hypothetical protein
MKARIDMNQLHRVLPFRPARSLASGWICIALCACASTDSGSREGQATFESPAAAVQRLVQVIGTQDEAALTELFGEGGIDLLRSGDDVADREDAERVRELIRERVAFEDGEDGITIALLGRDAWPLPIPLVPEGDRWCFDTEAGQDELESRRVGRNELSTIATLHAYVDAQREYAALPRDGAPPCYAQRVLSSEGKRDGLYWPAKEGEDESPFGPLVAAAADEGYQRDDGDDVFHGYRFRILTGQGKNAPGGARTYLDAKGRMTGGFAMLAWPAKHGSSGVMTFQVDSRGIVYQKDLGDDTEKAASAIQAFDVDASWVPTPE